MTDEELDTIAKRAREGLTKALTGEAIVDKASKGETMAIEGWLEYGAALNEGRAQFASNEQFGQWVSDNLPRTKKYAQSDTMWAAGNEVRREEITLGFYAERREVANSNLQAARVRAYKKLSTLLGSDHETVLQLKADMQKDGISLNNVTATRSH